MLGAAIVTLVFTAGPLAAQGLDWADGVGMIACSQLSEVEDSELVAWIQGYWSGANLYLGSTDLCLERAHITNVPASSVRTLIEVQCAPFPDAPIMIAAFNALKGLPTLPGSRAARCQKD